METKPLQDKKATEFLANERTFLAWMRTCVSIISLGFVVAKFGVWLRELAVRFEPGLAVHGSGASLPLGIAMMGSGGFFALLAGWHYHRMNLAIERGEVKANPGLALTMTIFVILLAVVMIAYMLLTTEHL